MQKLSDYLLQALQGFDADPPDTDFQLGYKAALIEVGKAMKVNLPFEQWERT